MTETSDKEFGSSGALAPERSYDSVLQENRLLRELLSSSSVSDDAAGSETGSRYSRVIRNYLNLRRRNSIAATTHDWDAPVDVEYSHKNEQFKGVLHVFHRQWLGIRAAAGSLPGMKLAIDAHDRLSRSDFKTIANTILSRGTTRIVVHAMSPNMAELVRYLSAVGMAQSIYIVYHGNIVQWCSEQERRFALSAIDLQRAGRARKLHFMKAGNDVPDVPSSGRLLLNMSPIVPDHYRQRTRSFNHVLVPGTSGWRKNIFCNALGAAMTPQVERVLHYASDVEIPRPFESKLERVEHVDRRTTLRLMSNCVSTLYVSVVECHPMVNLESEAVGTPCLRNPLFLDALEEHDYVRLVEVGDFASPLAISEKLRRVMSVDRNEMVDLIEDYLSKLNRLAMLRYVDFLEL